MQSYAEQIQFFFNQLFASIGTILKVIIRSKFFIKYPKNEEAECYILGNGPSMKANAAQFHQILKSKKLWVVNYFGNSDLFELLQPSFYLIVGPEFWREGVRQRNIDLRKLLFDNLVEKTKWPMAVFLPAEAFKSKFLKPYLKQNANLQFVPFNGTPVEGFNIFERTFFRWRLGMPRPHNVVIPAIHIALNMHFKKIYLLGVEHSWLPTISVNENNEVLLRNKHFYDTKELKNHRMYYLGIRPRMLHEVLHKFMLTFKGYFILKNYADSLGATIVNTTEDSFIDAFPRQKLESIFLEKSEN